MKYLGWFDGNPANLYQLPPEEASKKYVEFMGGAEQVLEKAQEAFNKGEYRWVAEVVNHVVFADPKNQKARELQADVLEQLGYQSESGPWRNFYLTGAQELRQGVEKLPVPHSSSIDTVKAMSLSLFFDYLGVRLNGEKAAGKKRVFNLNFTDPQEQYVLNLENAALTYQQLSPPNQPVDRADVSLTLTRDTINKIILEESTLAEEIASGAIQVQGNLDALSELVSLLDTFEFWFNIVEP